MRHTFMCLYLIYGEYRYLANVHFCDIPHTFIQHSTLHSTEKKSALNFPQITRSQLSAFRIPRSAKYPIPLPFVLSMVNIDAKMAYLQTKAISHSLRVRSLYKKMLRDIEAYFPQL